MVIMQKNVSLNSFRKILYLIIRSIRSYFSYYFWSTNMNNRGSLCVAIY